MSDETLLGTGGADTTSADTGQQTAADGQPAAPATGEQPAAAPDANSQPAAAGDTPAPDAANADGTKPEDKKEANPFHGAPEGDYAIAAPEGVTYDDKVVEGVKGLSKELGLSQAGAQKLAEQADNIVKTMATAQADIVKQARTEWADQVKADPELGGTKLEANLAVVAKARDAFITPELKTVLDVSGLGNHPEMVRAFYKIGKAMSEDTMVVSNAGTSKDDRSHAQRLYPNNPQ